MSLIIHRISAISEQISIIDGARLRASPQRHKQNRIETISRAAGKSCQPDLMQWIKDCEQHPLIVSAVFHYELEFIHPFIDGNGRMGRLWQTLILGQWKPIFYRLPLESVICEHQQNYYEVLQKSDKAADCTVFVEFMLEAIHEVLQQNTLATDQANDQVSDQVKKLLLVMDKNGLSRQELMTRLGLSHKATFRKNYLNPALALGLIEMSNPNTPRSPKQKYRKK